MTDPEPTRIALVALVLLIFGGSLNYIVDRAEARGLDHYAWAFVVVGVSVTLFMSAFFVGWVAVLWVVGCFAASGAPMVMGALIRHEREVAAERVRLAQEKAMAEQERIALEAKVLELIRADQTTTPG